MKELTKAEEQVMHIIWKLKKCFVKDIVLEISNPKPAYTTISTIVRILEDKGFVGHKAYGKTHEYYPLVAKSEYAQVMMKDMLKKYFGNSVKQLVSYFSVEKDLSEAELKEIRQLIDEQLKSK